MKTSCWTQSVCHSRTYTPTTPTSRKSFSVYTNGMKV